jgi:solute carrier family 25 (mitochondrial carnitine/acylcarnitine transporter), member 20/29
MQTSAQHGTLAGAFTRVWQEGGFTSLFRGSMATLARDIPGSMAYFGTYEILKRNYLGGSTFGILTAGGFAGIANWLVAIPADVVKSRLQASTNASHSALGIFKEMIKNEGIFSLFRGIGPVMLRAFPANAACFFGMETGKSLLKNY